MKLPRYRHTVAPTHFQKQVGRGTWLRLFLMEISTPTMPLYNGFLSHLICGKQKKRMLNLKGGREFID